MYATINEANAAVIAEIRRARPRLVDVRPAGECIPALAEGPVLMHAGPPIEWSAMTGPMKGAVLGACLFEGWAKTADEAEAFAAAKIRFVPCHDNSAVGPMGGITSAHMPVLVVKNAEQGNVAYCNLNEGIGKVMRFGAFEGEVQTRLAWMRDVLAPVLSAALKKKPDGIDLTALMAQAITMGDEFHQRNIAASALLMKALAADIAAGEASREDKEAVLRFLERTDQFFLNVAMAHCKCVMDAGHAVGAGSIVTAMTRNGRDFGIRVAGLGNRWFTAPVNTPVGLFFTGYSQADANPDIGDSAITETYGIGGFAMGGAPAIVQFVGGTVADALAYTARMYEITLAENANYTIPNMNFRGAPTGIDVRRVIASGLLPVINTGMAHRLPGIGQVGAGVVRPPRECFDKALTALARGLKKNSQSEG